MPARYSGNKVALSRLDYVFDEVISAIVLSEENALL